MKSTLLSLVFGLVSGLCLTAASTAQSFKYDAVGRLVEVAYTGGRTILYTYNSKGNPTKIEVIVSASSGTENASAPDDASEPSAEQAVGATGEEPAPKAAEPNGTLRGSIATAAFDSPLTLTAVLGLAIAWIALGWRRAIRRRSLLVG